jgi:hypothetical protein
MLDGVNAEYAKGLAGSPISTSDYKSFYGQIKALQQNRGLAAGFTGIAKQLERAARKTTTRFLDYTELPRLQEALASARQRFFQGGDKAEAEALQRGINILAMEEPSTRHKQDSLPYPTFMPLPEKLGISTSSVREWTPEDYQTAYGWAHFGHPGWGKQYNKLTAAQRDRNIEQLEDIKAFLDVWWAASSKAGKN